jgi:hypothetical protein
VWVSIEAACPRRRSFANVSGIFNSAFRRPGSVTFAMEVPAAMRYPRSMASCWITPEGESKVVAICYEVEPLPVSL